MKLRVIARFRQAAPKFKIGDEVRINHSNAIYKIVEVDPNKEKATIETEDPSVSDLSKRIPGIGFKEMKLVNPPAPKAPSGPACWGCGKDYLRRWDKSDLVTLGRDKLCPDCYEEIQDDPGQYYDVTMGSIRDVVGNASDMGDPEKKDWDAYDYDVDVSIPIKVKRKDGKPFDSNDLKLLQTWIRKDFSRYIKREYRMDFSMYPNDNNTELVPSVSFL
jgi:hypothetical protein